MRNEQLHPIFQGIVNSFAPPVSRVSYHGEANIIEVRVEGCHAGTILRNVAGWYFEPMPGAGNPAAGKLFGTLRALKNTLEAAQ